MSADHDPLARQAGRAAGRWWVRQRPRVMASTRPARRGWAVLVGQLWLLGYTWVGVLLAVGLRNLTRSGSAWPLVVGVAGGVALGVWQARHRMARHERPGLGPPTRFALALWTWIAAIALAAWLTAGG